jgi:hypothetical protein
MEIALGQGASKSKTVVGVQSLESLRNKKVWYSIKPKVGNTFWVKESNERIAVYCSDTKIMADCRLYYAQTEVWTRNYLNSTVY